MPRIGPGRHNEEIGTGSSGIDFVPPEVRQRFSRLLNDSSVRLNPNETEQFLDNSGRMTTSAPTKIKNERQFRGIGWDEKDGDVAILGRGRIDNERMLVTGRIDFEKQAHFLVEQERGVREEAKYLLAAYSVAMEGREEAEKTEIQAQFRPYFDALTRHYSEEGELVTKIAMDGEPDEVKNRLLGLKQSSPVRIAATKGLFQLRARLLGKEVGFFGENEESESPGKVRGLLKPGKK